MIDHADIERLKEIFVTREECSTNQSIMDGRVNAIAVENYSMALNNDWGRSDRYACKIVFRRLTNGLPEV